MAVIRLSEVVEVLQAKLVGDDTSFEFVSIDSRITNPGELFIAIEGPHFDGHLFIDEAVEKGAVAAMVTRQIPSSIPLLLVDDIRLALGRLAAYRRAQLNIPILSVTGSCGKTTTKSMMASIMSHCGYTHAGKKSYNNHYGAPLSILGISDEHEYAIIEMGANHEGEIAYLTHIVRPTVAAITLAAPVHLEGFGNMDGVARGKGEIFQGLTPGGTAVINADDGYAPFWRELAKDHKILTFGFSSGADFYATDVAVDEQSRARFKLHCPLGERSIQLPLLGEHNIVNALAAACAAYAAGATLDAICQGLETVTPVDKRMVLRKGIGGTAIYDDCYNANPLGFEAALKVLSHSKGKKILVVGEMAELGSDAISYHRQLGEKALQYGIQALYAYGGLTQHTVDAFGTGAHFFTKQEELISQLKGNLGPDVRVLVKGSRGMQMERVVEALLENNTSCQFHTERG